MLFRSRPALPAPHSCQIGRRSPLGLPHPETGDDRTEFLPTLQIPPKKMEWSVCPVGSSFPRSHCTGCCLTPARALVRYLSEAKTAARSGFREPQRPGVKLRRPVEKASAAAICPKRAGRRCRRVGTARTPRRPSKLDVAGDANVSIFLCLALRRRGEGAVASADEGTLEAHYDKEDFLPLD